MSDWTPEEQRQIEMQAEVYRRAMNPSLQDRSALLQPPPPLPAQIVRCESPTGALITARIIQRKNIGKGPRQTLTFISYKYPASQILRNAKYDCVDGPDVYHFAEGSRPADEDTGRLSPTAKQQVYRDTYMRDLLEFNDRPLSHCKARGLKVLDMHVDEGHSPFQSDDPKEDAIGLDMAFTKNEPKAKPKKDQ